MNARARRRLWLLVAVGAGPWALLALLLDAWGHRDPPAGPYDTIIVAGCRVMPDGQPSVALQRRAELAVELWRQNPDSVVIFTGGVGDFTPSEAIAASTWAQARGLPAAVIRLEDRSTSTEENARFAAEHYPAKRVLLVTTAYHTLRAGRVFGRFYDEVETAGASSDLSSRLVGSLREVPALGWYALRGRL